LMLAFRSRFWLTLSESKLSPTTAAMDLSEDARAAMASLQDLSKPCLALDAKGMHELKVVCEASKEMLTRGVEGLVEESMGVPMMTSKSCDGTPLRVVHKKTRSMPSGSKVVSKGKMGA